MKVNLSSPSEMSHLRDLKKKLIFLQLNANFKIKLIKFWIYLRKSKNNGFKSKSMRDPKLLTLKLLSTYSVIKNFVNTRIYYQKNLWKINRNLLTNPFIFYRKCWPRSLLSNIFLSIFCFIWFIIAQFKYNF